MTSLIRNNEHSNGWQASCVCRSYKTIRVSRVLGYACPDSTHVLDSRTMCNNRISYRWPSSIDSRFRDRPEFRNWRTPLLLTPQSWIDSLNECRINWWGYGRRTHSSVSVRVRNWTPRQNYFRHIGHTSPDWEHFWHRFGIHWIVGNDAADGISLVGSSTSPNRIAGRCKWRRARRTTKPTNTSLLHQRRTETECSFVFASAIWVAIFSSDIRQHPPENVI